MNITNKIDMYLNEAKIETIGEFSELVKRDCSKFLKEIKQSKRFVYRGISGVGKMGIKTPRPDREPKDMSLAGHNYLGKLFKKYHGWNARKEGVFCFGDVGDASSYGDTYIVFPVDGYKYLWSDDIRDLYSCVEEDRGLKYKGYYVNYCILWNENALFDFMKDYDDEDDILFKADNELNILIKNYSNNNLNKYLTGYSNYELVLKCKKYYYIKWSDKNESELKRSLYK